MTANIESIRQCVREFDFTRLFIRELGWDYHRVTEPVEVDGATLQLRGVAKKSGFQVFHYPAPDGEIPERAVRQKIDNAVAKSALEHLIVYTDAAGTSQQWQWTLRLADKPAQYREDRYERGQSGQRLAEKLRHLFVSIDEEADITISDVSARVALGFRKDRVAKKFYDRFDKERKGFLPKIAGIPFEGDRDWYASIMLNRLMFVYFIQSKGFLNNDQQYLQHKLRDVQARQGRDQFYSFYRHFLLELFHKGLGAQPPRPTEIEALLGDVPYLNGGIFEQHQIEQTNPNIHIPDDAFEAIFAFFDDYDWHLDDRPLRDDKQINPDVLGYIFEKYINQKQMGAYYTKEDITEYISKNTIIPFLFDQAKKDCAIAFQPGSATWGLLKDNPDRYIYEAVRKGTELPLPSEIEAGRTDVSKRGPWNAPADAEFALPTEWWREHVARRERYEEIKDTLATGEVESIDDFITYNLDIRQFAQDVIQHSEGPELVRAFFKAIKRVSVLDPTCGSGAFLFAALNVLAPLYDACLERMEEFVTALDSADEAHHPQKFSDFRQTLAETSERGRDYYISKTIILNNLYGVDIMEEAVEICKLRLFLKLASELQAGETPEPLPDIDFNIRAGNTLVGFASMDEVRKAVLHDVSGKMRLPLPEDTEAMRRIEDGAKNADGAYRLFRQQQTELGGRVTPEHKQELREQLVALSAQLDRYQAVLYGIVPGNTYSNDGQPQSYDEKFAEWRESHEPFHWLVDFYGIMQRGGFDVIIGNPPWIEYSKVRRKYTVKDYHTEACGNLHGICTERGLRLRSPQGSLSFIVQLPLANSSRMAPVRDLLRRQSADLYVTTFDDRPGKLFEGLQHCRSTIFVSRRTPRGDRGELFTTRYQRWYTETRATLFSQFEFARVTGSPLHNDLFPKYANDSENSLFQRVHDQGRHPMGFAVVSASKAFVFYQESAQYWIKATVGLPHYEKNGIVGAPAHGRYLYFDSEELAETVSAIMNSSLFYAYFIAYGDCFHLNDSLVRPFPVSSSTFGDPALSRHGNALMTNLRENAGQTSITTRDGDRITYAEFVAAKSKPIIDEIDRVLAGHYGFTEEELDFIVNYDIKFRMGREGVGNRE